MEFFIDGKSPIELKAELAEERALRAQIEAERLKERDRRMELERELELMKAQIAELKK